MFQQKASDTIVPDLHIIEQIQGANMYDAKHKQVVNKKVKYADKFGKIKKALNLVLDLECEEKLINLVIQFIDQKKTMIKNTNNKSAQLTIIDSLVTKHREHLQTKRLKSSFENQDHRESACNQAIDPQDSNLKIPFSNIDLNDNVLNNNTNKLCNKKRKYVCNVYSKIGHNSYTYKQQQ
ncbi:hypothetical protein C2G38_2037454 [Gigaspora rosea]|uniref:Uncharacterized protein n=1 Tax=Gigaspora rosea TaxID=44941 RepID=A0A397VCN7_9GLOM|nr:hypothetical protein C2G38_2037454 [Gigaspora rosea]